MLGRNSKISKVKTPRMLPAVVLDSAQRECVSAGRTVRRLQAESYEKRIHTETFSSAYKREEKEISGILPGFL
jgi:hypothetical protein